MHTHTRTVLIISSALLFASITGFGLFFHKLQMQKATYESLRVKEAEETARHTALESLLATFEKTNDARAVLTQHVLTESTTINFLSLVETLGREEGVVLSTDQLTVEPINAQFENLVATVSVEGRYDAVMQMLALLEQLPYEAHVENVSLGREGDGWKGVFQVRILKFKNV